MGRRRDITITLSPLEARILRAWMEVALREGAHPAVSASVLSKLGPLRSVGHENLGYVERLFRTALNTRPAEAKAR